MSWVNSLSNRDLLAKTLQAEAGNQGIGGMMAVGAVVMNRVGSGQSIRDVILAPKQFSPWNMVTAGLEEQAQDMKNLQPSADAYAVADSLLSGNYVDPTGGALNFYNPDISSPDWGPENTSDWLRIGDHIFGTAGGKKPVATPNQQPNILNAVQNAQQNLPSEKPIKAGFQGIMQALQNPRTQRTLGALSRSDTGRRLQAIAEADLARQQATAGGPTVRSQTLYRNGTLVQSTDQGPRVYDPSGKLVTGADQARVIAEANAAETKLRGEQAQSTQIGKVTADIAKDVYTKAQKVGDSISTIDRAIAAIDGGGISGFLTDYLPNITAASAELRSAMNQMGLDVVASATFGALSESEMNIAMSTAVPQSLSGPALREWLLNKKRLQVEARNSLERAASYLSQPGNTLGGYIKEQEQRRQQSEEGGNPMGRFANMDRNQILQVDMSKLNATEKAQLLRRLKELNNG